MVGTILLSFFAGLVMLALLALSGLGGVPLLIAAVLILAVEGALVSTAHQQHGL